MMNTIADVEQRALWYAWSVKMSWWLDRVRYFLAQLWDPQLSYKMIHVAGTSGKGTTCWMMSHCLYRLWYRVGLTMSPHVLDIRERCMVNGQLISKSMYVQYMNNIKDIFDVTDWSQVWQPSYFEIMMVAAMYIFAQEELDYVILETWLGWRLDATNIVDSPDKICVITSIGYDHQKFLWETLDLITREKAMITHPWNHCFSYHQDAIVDATIEQVVQEQWWVLHRVDSDHHYPLPRYFVWQHNQRNMSVVDWVLQYLHTIWIIQQEVDIVHLMSDCPPLLARMQEMAVWETAVIIDGAHNVQKMSALIQWLWERYGVGQRYVFVIACKEDKNVREVLQVILPHASMVICTEFGDLQQDYPLHPVDAQIIHKICIELWFDDVRIELDHTVIIDWLVDHDMVVVTGSFYLASSFIKLLS